MQITPRNGDLTIAVLLLAVAAFFIWGALRMPAGTFSVPGPAIVPLILGTLLGATALILIVKTLVSRTQEPVEPVTFGLSSVLILFGSLTAVAFAFEPAGFDATIGIFLFAMLRTFSRLGTLRSALLAVAITLVAHGFFASLLGVNLPRGPWPQWM